MRSQNEHLSHLCFRSSGLCFETVEDHTIVTEARGEECAAESAAGIERDRIRTFDQSTVSPIRAAHHASVCFIGLEQLDERSDAPPERIAPDARSRADAVQWSNA